VKFAIEEIVKPSGEDVQVDWHGHRDRGLGLVNCLAAIEAGADRVHATGLGLGERVGNAEMDQLIVNLYLLGTIKKPIPKLREYCELVAEACGGFLPPNYPVMGVDAFRTGTGVHAAAVIKAKNKGDDWLADRVYSGVPAGSFGARQVIEISPMSGLSNVKFWLSEHGYDPDDEALSQRLFQAAKEGVRTLTEEECHALIADVQGKP
jgi:2-isopropylmalate synthase